MLVQRLLGFALDGDAPDAVTLAAIRDARDRAGLNTKTAVEVETGAVPLNADLPARARTDGRTVRRIPGLTEIDDVTAGQG